LSRDLRKNAGLVYTIDSSLDAGKSRSVYVVQYACDPPNVAKVHEGVAREIEEMRTMPVTSEELHRAKALLLRQMPLAQASTGAIALGMIARWDLDLPLDEPSLAARRYIGIDAEQIKSAFAKWLRPAALVQATQGPSSR
jgi:zinc protease